jgi:plastocyanin
MAIQLQLRRGNALQHASFTGAIGEVTFDTSNNTIRAHDGNTAGGFELATKTDLANVSIGNVTASANLASNTTDDLPEGSNNLYFTNALAIGALTAGDNITIEANGLVVVAAVSGLANVATSGEYADLANTPSIPTNTTDIVEGANLYFTNARAIGALTGGTGVTIEANGMLVGTAVSNTGGTVTSIGILGGDLIDIDGGPITSDGNITVNVDLSELTSRVSANAVDSIAAIDSVSQEQYKVRLSNLTLSTFNNDLSLTTDTIPESSNLYFTNTRAIAALTAGENITIEANGMIIGAADGYVYSDSNVAQYLTAVDANIIPSVDGTLDLGNNTNRFAVTYTDNIGIGNIYIKEVGSTLYITSSLGGNVNLFNTNFLEEGDQNLYFSNTRAVDALTGQNVSLFTNDVGYLDANVTTADVAENAANLYFTNTRAILSVFPAVTQLTVTTPVFNYNLDQYSGDNPEIYVTAGETIAFDLNQTSSHPFAIRVSNGGSNYDTGLTHIDDDGTISTGSAAQGKYTGKLFWKVPYDLAGNTYVYQCTNHSSMVGNIVISNPAAVNSNSLTDTDDLPEGTANLYFTNTRAIGALTAGENILIEANGVITVDYYGVYYALSNSLANVATTGEYSDLANTPAIPANTTDITEGANLYFTNTRAIGALTGGDNITIEANGMIIGAAGGASSTYGDSNVDTYLGAVGVDVVPDSNTRNLGEVSNVWNNVYAENVIVSGQITTPTAGVPTIESDTSIRLTANDSVVVTSSPLQLASFSLGEIQSLTGANGMMVYNTTNTKIQAYVNGSWIDLH